jgi:hypothetical protein
VQKRPENEDCSNLVFSGLNSGYEGTVYCSIAKIPPVTMSNPAQQATSISSKGTPASLLATFCVAAPTSPKALLLLLDNKRPVVDGGLLSKAHQLLWVALKSLAAGYTMLCIILKKWSIFLFCPVVASRVREILIYVDF